MDNLKIFVIDIDDFGDLFDLLFDVNEIKKILENENKSELDFVNIVDDELLNLLDNIEENDLYKDSDF